MLALLDKLGQMFTKRQPLWLPRGSIRAVIALLLLVAYVRGVSIPLEILTLVLGFYFAQRSAQNSPPSAGEA